MRMLKLIVVGSNPRTLMRCFESIKIAEEALRPYLSITVSLAPSSIDGAIAVENLAMLECRDVDEVADRIIELAAAIARLGFDAVASATCS